MFKFIYTSFSIIAVTFLVFACGEDSNPVTETKNFTSVFDSNQFSDGFFPIDIQQTTDGGYVVLAESKLDSTQLTGVYLLKADKYGNFVKFIKADTLYNPIGRLSKIANTYYFFCMKKNTNAKLASFDENLDNFKSVSVAYTNPAASAPIEDGLLLLSVNTDSKQTIIAQIGLDGGTIRDKGFSFGDGDDSEKPLSEHFLKQGKQFPFDVGMLTPGIYYFNGFYNYTFSLVFTNMSDDDPIGTAFGFLTKGGFSAITPLSASKYAAARYNFGDNYFLPNLSLVATSESIISNFGGLTIPELISETKVKILRTTVNQKNVLVYAADTETRQIGLYFYDEATGAFIGSKYLGFSNPFTIGNLINTEDGGIAVAGTTYLAGRFARLCIFKLSKEEVASNVK
jgi:hypothetical protein